MKLFSAKDFKPDSIGIEARDFIDIEYAANIANAKYCKALGEAKDILESVAAAGGFSIPFRARHWLKKYGGEK